MLVFGSVVVCVAIVHIAEAINDDNRNLPLAKAEIENPASSLLKYGTLEERVQALEFQMENVHDDIIQINTDVTTLNSEVTDLEEDIESQITIIQADISVINSEQNIQDAQLLEIENSVENIEVEVARMGKLETSIGEVNKSLAFELKHLNQVVGELLDDLQELLRTLQETDAGLSEELSKFNTSFTMVTDNVQGLTDVTDDLLVSVASLRETDFGLRHDIVRLTAADRTLDSRISQLEVDGTVAFHAALGRYSSIPEESIVTFDNVNVNLGGAYSRSTGKFTTPSGGAGLYYFYVHVLIGRYRWAWISIRHNGITVAMINEDETTDYDFPSGSCGAVIMMEEGNNLLIWDILLIVN